jgi:hypothetical protein
MTRSKSSSACRALGIRQKSLSVFLCVLELGLGLLPRAAVLRRLGHLVVVVLIRSLRRQGRVVSYDQEKGTVKYAYMRGRDGKEMETKEFVLNMEKDSNKVKEEGERKDESILIEDAVVKNVGVDSQQVYPISRHRQ